MMGISARHAPALDLPARFMALAVASFAVSALTAPWTLPLLQDHFSDFRLLAFVHLNTLGFVGAMIFGASYQLVPVVLQTQLASLRLGRWSFWCYLLGLGVFLGGLERTWLPGLAIGGSLLAVAFVIYAGVMLVTCWRAPCHEVIGAHIVTGVVSAQAGMTLGVLMAFNKSSGMLGGKVLDLLAAHIVLMLAGWVLVTLTGVGYRLICMFTLAEKHFRPGLAWAGLALNAGGAWLLAARFAFGGPAWPGQLAALMLLMGIGCVIAQVERLYRRRMRRAFDIHIPFVIVAGAALVLAASLLVIGLFRHALANDPVWIAVGWLAIFGVAGTAIQGFFYKISTFLVWLKRYGPVAGKQPVPKLEQLYDRLLALAGLAAWTTAVGGGSVAILAGWSILSLVGVAMALGAACFLGNVGGIARHWLTGHRLPLREPVVSRQPHLHRR